MLAFLLSKGSAQRFALPAVAVFGFDFERRDRSNSRVHALLGRLPFKKPAATVTPKTHGIFITIHSVCFATTNDTFIKHFNYSLHVVLLSAQRLALLAKGGRCSLVVSRCQECSCICQMISYVLGFWNSTLGLLVQCAIVNEFAVYDVHDLVVEVTGALV